MSTFSFRFAARILPLVGGLSIGLLTFLPAAANPEPDAAAAVAPASAEDLVGRWIVDLRPSPDAPEYLKELRIDKLKKGVLEGAFYDTEFSEGRVNTGWGRVHFAFETSDGEGTYSTQGVLRGDRIEGRTFAAHRGSLWVWTARRDGKTGAAAAQTHAAVRAAAADYVRAIYEANPALVERSVHPGLFKAGYYRPTDSKNYRSRSMFTFEELISLAKSWNAKGERKDLSYDVEVLDVLDQTASARVRADWGYDYMLLAREPDGRWMIRQILWQSAPPKR